MTPAETTDLQTIQAALHAGRRKGASLPQLMKAHELAEKHQLSWCVAELRKHIRAVIPNPDRSTDGMIHRIGFGMFTGVLTFFLLRYLTNEKAPRIIRVKAQVAA